jgi:hypothetical protein
LLKNSQVAYTCPVAGYLLACNKNNAALLY